MSVRPAVSIAALVGIACPICIAASPHQLHEFEDAWYATHIVVVDSHGAILESWAGDLKRGHIIPLAELSIPEKPPTYQPPRPSRSGPSDSQLLLFLTRSQKEDGTPRWCLPKSYGGTFPPVGWLEDDHVYVLCRALLSDPGYLFALNCTVGQYRQAVIRTTEEKAALRRAAEQADGIRRAAAVARILETSSCQHSWDEGLEILVGCGQPALPFLNQILATRRFSGILDAMVGAGGKDALPYLIEFVDCELAYWAKADTAAHADPSWWRKEPASSHAMCLRRALELLQELRVPTEQTRVIERLADLWTSTEELRKIDRVYRRTPQYQIAAGARRVLEDSRSKGYSVKGQPNKRVQSDAASRSDGRDVEDE